MLSMLPQYNEKMITLHLMCPIVFLKHSGIFFRTVSTFSDQIEVAIQNVWHNKMTIMSFHHLGSCRIYGNWWNVSGKFGFSQAFKLLLQQIVTIISNVQGIHVRYGRTVFSMERCKLMRFIWRILRLLLTISIQDIFIEPKIFDHFPNSVSYKQLIHYGQIIRAGGGNVCSVF